MCIRDSIDIGSVELIEAADGNEIDTYLHVQDGRGVNGVVVEGSGVDTDTLHQIALHIAFSKPSFLDKDQVSDDDVAKERAALLEITKSEGKPEQAWDKIVDGRLTAWYRDRVLLEQELSGADSKTSVAEAAAPGTITRFEQTVIGA